MPRVRRPLSASLGVHAGAGETESWRTVVRVVAGCGKDAGIWGQDTRVSFLALPLNSRVTGTRRIPLWVSPPGSPKQPGATCLSSRFRVQPSGKQTPLMRPACTRPRPHSLTKSGVLPCARCVTPAGSAEASPGKHRAYHAKAGGEGGHELGKPRAGTCMVAQNRAAAPDPTAQFSGGLDS